ncbi:fluoride efflux transporter CrcB [Xinfangfangia pollutisoli]|uniref:fluoride efflux transporter CrcB n=1 Tax=Xinfangfangia pollutisoli TaxID=2865960 RepID=UPI001CD27130|nr:fluoride efflux transporter CrcB [Xinfangfangia pollutisoli]
MTTHPLLQVAAGGALGASARYLTNIGLARLLGTGFPWGTLAVNVLGAFAMGFLVTFLAHKDLNRLAPLLMTGILGGFTTFSAFSLDTITLYERGQPALAAAYVAGSVLLSLGAITLALHLFRGVFA